ncbi:MAG: hypothetical protein F6K21_35120 [Symploca sp. SIO2D2]|nr:hypothetical protein [Symploca sp. SIO2D2]
MTQRNREHLYSKFEQGAKPSEQDFRDLIDSTLNINDDHIKRETNELKVAAPLRVTTNPDDTEETLLKFYAGENKTWSINQKSGENNGLNISDANGASRLFIESEDGNVGIGTTKPSAPLQVKATKETDPHKNGLYIYNPTDEENQHAILGLQVAGKKGGNPFISWDVKGDGTWSMGIDNQDGNKLKIAPTWKDLNNSTLMTFDGQGRVGIGTTEPSAPLQVTATKTSDPNPANNGLCIYNPNKEQDQHAILGLRVAGKEGGNPFVSWDVAGESGWSMGIDNQDENKLKIAPNWANLTNSTLMTFDGQGSVDINGELSVSKGIIFEAEIPKHINRDGALYRHGGQVYLTVDDNLYLRKSNTTSTVRLSIEDNGRLKIGGEPLIKMQKYGPIAGEKETDYTSDKWICGIVGFESTDGDILEDGVGKIIYVHTFIRNNKWWIAADFRSHNTHENWNIWLMAVNTVIAEKHHF